MIWCIFSEHIPSLEAVPSNVLAIDRASRRQVSFSIKASVALINRDAVLDFLAKCPPLADLDEWSQWSVSGLLPDRWGSLEQFLSESGASKGTFQSP